MKLNQDVLKLDPEPVVRTLCRRLKEVVAKQLKRRGLVVALSGGIDSSVTVALCTRALGARRVLALLMPERDCSQDTLALSRLVVSRFDVASHEEDITSVLEAVGFYQRYRNAVRSLVPDYGPGWRSKIVLSQQAASPGYNFFYLVARSPGGDTVRCRLPLQSYLQIVAATNFKQRTRKMFEYYYADRHHYAVAGTPNRLELDQGFFVKGGDGLADVKPIAHLYKTQVYQLAEYLGVPEAVRSRPPTTDTYSLAQGQDEFYFSLPYQQMDLCLYAKNHGYAPADVAPAVQLSPQQVERVYREIDSKRSTTRYLHLPPLLLEPVEEIVPWDR